MVPSHCGEAPARYPASVNGASHGEGWVVGSPGRAGVWNNNNNNNNNNTR